jgi:hypothetical protein
MIGQYLSNTNESATVSIFQNFSELNKASRKKESATIYNPQPLGLELTDRVWNGIYYCYHPDKLHA